MEEMLKNKTNSVLKGKANIIIKAAKKRKDRPCISAFPNIE